MRLQKYLTQHCYRRYYKENCHDIVVIELWCPFISEIFNMETY